jgi:outer membrane immunogenic protein
MRRRSLTLLALATIGLAASQASAADLPRKAPAYVPPAPPPYVWTGCYIGGNVGAAFAHVDVTNVVTGGSGSRSSETSFAGGGQIGCDYQFYNSWVVGIRNMFDGTDIHRTRTFALDPTVFPTGGGSVETKVKWFDALTGRLGYLVAPNWLIYGQGGAAWTKAEVTAFNGLGAQIGSISGNSRTGWVAGGGVEWMFVPHWSVFVEYNYMGFGTRSSSFVACGVANCGVFSAKANVQDVLVGVNYKF